MNRKYTESLQDSLDQEFTFLDVSARKKRKYKTGGAGQQLDLEYKVPKILKKIQKNKMTQKYKITFDFDLKRFINPADLLLKTPPFLKRPIFVKAETDESSLSPEQSVFDTKLPKENKVVRSLLEEPTVSQISKNQKQMTLKFCDYCQKSFHRHECKMLLGKAKY